MITVKDSQNLQFIGSFTLRTLQISTAVLPGGTVGVPYSAGASAFGASPAAVWSLTSGTSLPPGLGVSSSGVISGSPTQSAPFPFILTLTDVQGSISQSLSITLNPGLGISPSSRPAGPVRTHYRAS